MNTKIRQCLHYENMTYVDVHKAFKESINILQGNTALYRNIGSILYFDVLPESQVMSNIYNIFTH